MDKLNNFSCICYPGYTGRTCRDDYDDCQSSPCVHGKQNGCVSVCVSQNKKGIRKARMINSLSFFILTGNVFSKLVQFILRIFHTAT